MKQLNNSCVLCNGKYKISKVLGQGGFGITYLAKQKIAVEGTLGTIEAEIAVTIKEFFMKEFCKREEASLWLQFLLRAVLSWWKSFVRSLSRRQETYLS